MALKAKINERCDRCGKRAARLVGDFIIEMHDCPNLPPGPRHPAGRGRVSAASYSFVPAEFSAEELKADLDAAFLEIERLGNVAMDRKKRLDDVFIAMKGYLTNRIA